MTKRRFYVIVAITTLLLFSTNFISAQKTLDGSVTDADDHSALIGATVKLIPLSDSTQWQGVATDIDGKFQFNQLANGAYHLTINYIGYKTTNRQIHINGADKHLGQILLAKSATNLKDVAIVGKEVRAEQKEDTSDYNANAFKSNKDATAEDLVAKMPGITSSNGVVTAQGEQVSKVLIDGKEFFGDDATLALKNLPAEIVDRVQVFDRMSDQANFTGFDDGNSKKAMNIITKQGMNNGVFGKLYAGYGYLTDSRYSAGGSVNWFDGNRRLSVIGMSNNVNQQNFSSQDLLGLTGASSHGGRGRPGGGSGYSKNSAANNFLVGQQGGNSTTSSAGLNYSDVLGKKQNVKISAGYFFNLTDNINNTNLTRQYFSTGDSSSNYKEANNTTTRNINHRVNLRLDYEIDSMNRIIFTPKFSYQSNSQTNVIDGQTFLSEGTLLSQTDSRYTANNSGYNGSGDLLYQHKFNKRFRTISFDVGTNINNKFGTAAQNAMNSFQTASDSTTLDQQANSSGTSYQITGNVTYTEPAGKTGIIQLTYEPSYTWNKSDKETFNNDTALHTYSLLDTILSNKYDNNYMTHRATVGYRVKAGRLNLTVGVAAQYALLTGTSVFPNAYNTDRTFYNVLPNLRLTYKFKDNSNLRVFYRASTTPPSIAQLQSVIDNSNPLLLNTGNPDLKQSYDHLLLGRYGFTNTKTGQTFFAFAAVHYTQNYVGNSTLIASRDTVLTGDVVLHAGSQLTKPVNINGNVTLNSFFNYGLPITKIKCNINFSAGFSYNRSPGYINNALNFSNTYGITGGLVLSSNISDKIDFTISYYPTYNIVKNTLQTGSNNNYFTHTANLKFNWLFWKGFVFNTNLQNTVYTGVGSAYDQDIFLWNAALGYKFLKDESLDVRLGVNDILNQNSGISRTVTDTYVEDSRTQVLKRYLMLTVTYTLRYFKAAHKNL